MLPALATGGGEGTGERVLPVPGGLEGGRKGGRKEGREGGGRAKGWRDGKGGKRKIDVSSREKEGREGQTKTTYPKNNTPLGGVTLNRAKYSGYNNGNITISFNAVICPCNPPTLFQSNDLSTSTGKASARLKSLFP